MRPSCATHIVPTRPRQVVYNVGMKGQQLPFPPDTPHGLLALSRACTRSAARDRPTFAQLQVRRRGNRFVVRLPAQVVTIHMCARMRLAVLGVRRTVWTTQCWLTAVSLHAKAWCSVGVRTEPTYRYQVLTICTGLEWLMPSHL